MTNPTGKKGEPFPHRKEAASIIIDEFGGKASRAGRDKLKRLYGIEFEYETLRVWVKAEEKRRAATGAAVGPGRSSFAQQNARSDSSSNIDTNNVPMSLPEMEAEVVALISDWLASRKLDPKTALAVTDKLTKLKEAGSGQSFGMTGEMAGLWSRHVVVCGEFDPVESFRRDVEYEEAEHQRSLAEGWKHYQQAPFAAFVPSAQEQWDRYVSCCAVRGVVPEVAFSQLVLVFERANQHQEAQ